MGEFVIFATEEYYLITGIVLIVLVVLQMSFWVGGSVSNFYARRKQFKLSVQILEQKLAAAKVERTIAEGESGWSGFRTFCVAKLVREAENICSIYLTPQDQRPLPFFKPGQYLTFSLDIPGDKKPLIRCYSIANAPNEEYFRCTIKKIATMGANGEPVYGKASEYCNHHLVEGDLLQIRAPAGKFFVNLNDERPVVFLAGGIGITPIFSMLTSMLKFQPHRRAILFYGGRNSADYAFGFELQELARKHRNIHLMNCFSAPLETDEPGTEYDVKGHVTIDLVKSMLPSNNFLYYVCGPGGFMSSLVEGLVEWGVPDDQIHFEAFGPASVPRIKAKPNPVDEPVRACLVKFCKTGETVEWNDNFDSLLEAAEENGVIVNSGCRAGNCGTCEIGLLKGQVRYSKDPGVEPESGKALSCVACPDGDIEIDA